MKQIPQGMAFRKASASCGNGSCVSVAITEDAVYVRDTKDIHKTTLQFTRLEWECFLKGVRNGEFELPPVR